MATRTNNNKISQINLNSGLYDIYDASAVHSFEDLGLTGYMQFQGVVASFDDLPSEGEVGDVYHVIVEDSEYIWVKEESSELGHWEEFGSKLMINHTHDIPQLSGTVTVNGENAASEVTGIATVVGSNEDSVVSGSATVTIPKITKESKYIKFTATDADGFVTDYTGDSSKMATTSIISAGSSTSVVSSVTPTTKSVMGVKGSTTASKAVAGNKITSTNTIFDTDTSASKITASEVASSKVTLGQAIAVPSATANGTASKISSSGSVTAGSVPTWSAKVENEVLSFDFSAGAVTEVDLPTFTDVDVATVGLTYDIPNVISVTDVSASYISDIADVKVPVVSSNTEIEITPYTFTDVDVPVADEQISVVTEVSTGSTDVATVGDEFTVATGQLDASDANGAEIMIGLGTKTTKSAVVSAVLEAGENSDILVGDSINIETETVMGNVSGTAAAQKWTQTEGTVSGTAAAQKWTQTEGTVTTIANTTGSVKE